MSPRRRHVTHALLLLLLGALLLPVLAGAELSRKERQALRETLPETYKAWLETVSFLITDEELDAFLQLTKDYQRDAFIENFWRIRDPYPDTARNEFKERFLALVAQAKEEFESLEEDRARYLLIVGPPDVRIPVRCSALWPLEVWIYQATAKTSEPFGLLFYRRSGAGPYRLWRPFDGVSSLIQFANFNMTDGQAVGTIRNECRSDEGDAILAVLQLVSREGPMGYDSLLSRLEQAPQPSSSEWVQTFNSASTDLPPDAATFPAKLELSYPGRNQSRTVVRGLLSIPVAGIGVAELAGYRGYNFQLTGEVLRDDHLFDSFRYQFSFPVGEVTSESLPLLFERYLRPGDYRLVVKLEDVNSGKFFRTIEPISVPLVDTPPPPADPETARLLAEANAAISTGDNTIKLVPPQGDLQTGYIRFNTLVTGNDIAEVSFVLDGKPVLNKKRPPFSVELDLGSLPNMRTLDAVALDAAGTEVARDELRLNAGTNRFAVRLAEPRPGRRYSSSLRAEAKVETPDGEVVDRVEIYLNETLVATLYQEPYVQPILLPPGEPVAYVRAVAYLPDGNSTESVVFINAPDFSENLDVQFVELFITVADRSQHPVEGLRKEDFTVLEDGVPQQPMRFDVVRNLPIHAGVLVDVSASMKDSLETAQQAAVRFLQEAIQPRDRATLITFNDYPNLVVKFTNELDVLAGGLAGLRAERGTALYDSLIFTLYYFNGIKGQRAIILLSDGKDESSRFSWEQALEYARRSGVAIYAIGLNLKSDRASRKKLGELADETGGRSFFINDAGELGAIYEQIQQELRSRYFLAYQSTNSSADGQFRSIEVKVERPGLEAKTLRGYYP